MVLWYFACIKWDKKEWALSLTCHLIMTLEEWVGDSQRAFPKMTSACLTLSISTAFSAAHVFAFLDFCQDSALSFQFNSGMKHVNRTLLLPLLSRCRQILEDASVDISREQLKVTFSSSTVTPQPSIRPVATSATSSREAYDNAYFYILFVVVFYSFLAMTLFKCIGSDEEKKDPYEEFIRSKPPPTQKFNTGHIMDKFYFEEDSSLWDTGLLCRRRERVNAIGENGGLTVNRARKMSVRSALARPACDFAKPAASSFCLLPPPLWQSESSHKSRQAGGDHCLWWSERRVEPRRSVGQQRAGISSCEAQSGSITPGPSTCTYTTGELGYLNRLMVWDSMDTESLSVWVCVFSILWPKQIRYCQRVYF